MTKLIIFRHGETDWNKEHRVMGKNDIPLNNTGRIQAKDLAERVKNEKISVIYSSPLMRALQTAEIVGTNHKSTIKSLPALEEMSLGLLEGKTKEERKKIFPTFIWKNDSHRKKVKAETLQEWEVKLKKTTAALLKKHENQTIALSTHEWKMKALLFALGFNKKVLLSQKFKNCACIIARIDSGQVIFEYDANQVFKKNEAPNIDDLRKQLDEVDRNILEQLSKRMIIVTKIGEIKKQRHFPPLDQKRWETVIKTRSEMGKQLGLTTAFVTKIWHTIHKESLKKEEEV